MVLEAPNETEIPQEWLDQGIPPSIIKFAHSFGLIHPNWTLEDYLVHAVKSEGYETVVIWGVQGSGKSSRMLTMAHWIYQDWNLVLDNIIFKPETFVEKLESIPRGQRVPCILWDDIGVHYPSSKFKTDIKQYEAIDSAWAAIRTKCNIIITTIPLIDRLAKNIKDNVTFEVFIGKNQMELINRIYHLPGLIEMETGYYKVKLETPTRFNLYEPPIEVFNKYWERRLDLTEETIRNLRKVTDSTDTEGYMDLVDAAEMLGCKSVNTIQQMISRDVLSGKKINGRLYALREDIERHARLKKHTL